MFKKHTTWQSHYKKNLDDFCYIASDDLLDSWPAVPSLGRPLLHFKVALEVIYSNNNFALAKNILQNCLAAFIRLQKENKFSDNEVAFPRNEGETLIYKNLTLAILAKDYDINEILLGVNKIYDWCYSQYNSDEWTTFEESYYINACIINIVFNRLNATQGFLTKPPISAAYEDYFNILLLISNIKEFPVTDKAVQEKLSKLFDITKSCDFQIEDGVSDWMLRFGISLLHYKYLIHNGENSTFDVLKACEQVGLK